VDGGGKEGDTWRVGTWRRGGGGKSLGSRGGCLLVLFEYSGIGNETIAMTRAVSESELLTISEFSKLSLFVSKFSAFFIFPFTGSVF
jgi:hypothetical protein